MLEPGNVSTQKELDEPTEGIALVLPEGVLVYGRAVLPEYKEYIQKLRDIKMKELTEALVHCISDENNSMLEVPQLLYEDEKEAQALGYEENLRLCIQHILLAKQDKKKGPGGCPATVKDYHEDLVIKGIKRERDSLMLNMTYIHWRCDITEMLDTERVEKDPGFVIRKVREQYKPMLPPPPEYTPPKSDIEHCAAMPPSKQKSYESSESDSSSYYSFDDLDGEDDFNSIELVGNSLLCEDMDLYDALLHKREERDVGEEDDYPALDLADDFVLPPPPEYTQPKSDLGHCTATPPKNITRCASSESDKELCRTQEREAAEKQAEALARWQELREQLKAEQLEQHNAHWSKLHAKHQVEVSTDISSVQSEKAGDLSGDRSISIS